MCKLDPEKVVYQISKKIIEGFLSEILELWSAKHSIESTFSFPTTSEIDFWHPQIY